MDTNEPQARPRSNPPMPKRFVAVRKWKDGGEQVMEYFESQDDALEWIAKQHTSKNDFTWCVGEY